MNRLLALVVSAVLCWGGAMACSGGGGGGSGSSEQPSSLNATGPAGSTTADGGIVQADGTIKYSDGTIKKPDGTIVSGTGGGIVDTKLPIGKVSPLSVISGVVDGGIYGPVTITASAAESQKADSYTWTLTGPGFPNGLSGSGASFEMKLPEAMGSAAGYSLSLTATNASGGSDTKSISFQVYPPAIPKITLSNGALAKGIWPTNVMMLFAVESSLYANDSGYEWIITEPNQAPKHCPISKGGIVCQFTPKAEGQYTIKLNAKGLGGASKSPAEFVFNAKNSIPVVSISGLTEGQNTYFTPVTLTGSVVLGPGLDPNAPVVYTWFGKKDGVDIAEKSKDNPVIITDPGVYEANLTATVGDVTSAATKVSFEILKPLTAEIVDAATNKPLPKSSLISAKSKVTLQLKDAVPANYGVPYYSWKIKSPEGSNNITESHLSSITLTFDKAGEYAVLLNTGTELGASAVASVGTTAMPMAFGIVDGVDNGRSYLKRPFFVSAVESKGSPTSFAYTLINSASNKAEAESGVNVKPGWSFSPNDYGDYFLKLIVGNDLGFSAPKEIPFRVRASGGEEVLPFTLPSVTYLAATGSSDVYVGSSSAGLLHLGTDGQLVRLLSVPEGVGAVWERSNNEVFVVTKDANNQQHIVGYTPKDGWKMDAVAAVPGTFIRTLTGSADRLACLATDKSARVYSNGMWSGPFGINVMSVTMAPDNSVFALQSDGKIAVIDAGPAVLVELQLPANNTWNSLTAVSVNEAYFANLAGEIYKYDGNAVNLLATLPQTDPLIQPYAKALWIEDGGLRALSQQGGIYSVSAGQATSLYPDALGQLSAITATFGSSAVKIVVDSGLPYKFGRGNDGKYKWLPIFPANTDSLMIPVVADATTRARTSAETVYVLNAQTTEDGSVSYLQRITDKGRSSLPVTKPIFDAWGDGGELVVATADGLSRHAPNVAPQVLDAAGLDQPKQVKAIEGTKSLDFFVLTQLSVFHTIDGGATFENYLTPQPSGAFNASVQESTAMHVLPTGEVVVAVHEKGMAPADTYRAHIYDAQKALISNAEVFSQPIMQIAGPDLDHLYAIAGMVISKYDKVANTWNLVQGGNLPNDFTYRSIQKTATTLYFEADKGVVTIALSDGKVGVGAPGFAYHAQGSPDYVYSGLIAPVNNVQPQQGPMMLLRDGPMQ